MHDHSGVTEPHGGCLAGVEPLRGHPKKLKQRTTPERDGSCKSRLVCGTQTAPPARSSLGSPELGRRTDDKLGAEQPRPAPAYTKPRPPNPQDPVSLLSYFPLCRQSSAASFPHLTIPLAIAAPQSDAYPLTKGADQLPYAGQRRSHAPPGPPLRTDNLPPTLGVASGPSPDTTPS